MCVRCNTLFLMCFIHCLCQQSKITLKFKVLIVVHLGDGIFFSRKVIACAVRSDTCVTSLTKVNLETVLCLKYSFIHMIWGILI